MALEQPSHLSESRSRKHGSDWQRIFSFTDSTTPSNCPGRATWPQRTQRERAPKRQKIAYLSNYPLRDMAPRSAAADTLTLDEWLNDEMTVTNSSHWVRIESCFLRRPGAINFYLLYYKMLQLEWRLVWSVDAMNLRIRRLSGIVLI